MGTKWVGWRSQRKGSLHLSLGNLGSFGVKKKLPWQENQVPIWNWHTQELLMVGLMLMHKSPFMTPVIWNHFATSLCPWKGVGGKKRHLSQVLPSDTHSQLPPTLLWPLLFKALCFKEQVLACSKDRLSHYLIWQVWGLLTSHVQERRRWLHMNLSFASWSWGFSLHWV